MNSYSIISSPFVLGVIKQTLTVGNNLYAGNLRNAEPHVQDFWVKSLLTVKGDSVQNYALHTTCYSPF